MDDISGAGLLGGGGHCAIEQRLAPALHGRQRRFQVVRHVGHKIALGLLALLHLLNHLVKAGGEGLHLAGAAGGYPLAVIPCGDGGSGRGHPLQGCGYGTVDEIGEQEGQKHGHASCTKQWLGQKTGDVFAQGGGGHGQQQGQGLVGGAKFLAQAEPLLPLPIDKLAKIGAPIGGHTAGPVGHLAAGDALEVDGVVGGCGVAQGVKKNGVVASQDEDAGFLLGGKLAQNVGHCFGRGSLAQGGGNLAAEPRQPRRTLLQIHLGGHVEDGHEGNGHDEQNGENDGRIGEKQPTA